MDVFSDEYFMKQAIKQAEIAYEKNEVPVGAIIVMDKKIIAKSHNLTEKFNDITAHAEIQAITSASNYLNSKYLKNCTMYVTLEPCIMCCGALYWSKIDKVIYSAKDKKKGGISNKIKLHPKTKIENGLLENISNKILKSFFERKRY